MIPPHMRHDDLIKIPSSTNKHTITEQKVEKIPTPPWPNMETFATVQFNVPIITRKKKHKQCARYNK